MAQARGTVQAIIANHGEFQCKATDLDTLIEDNWSRTKAQLTKEIEERMGEPYDTRGMARIEILMVLAELSGFATN